jgi:hypothetical protein
MEGDCHISSQRFYQDCRCFKGMDILGLPVVCRAAPIAAIVAEGGKKGVGALHRRRTCELDFKVKVKLEMTDVGSHT